LSSSNADGMICTLKATTTSGSMISILIGLWRKGQVDVWFTLWQKGNHDGRSRAEARQAENPRY
jgi:hypothetical protein